MKIFITILTCSLLLQTACKTPAPEKAKAPAQQLSDIFQLTEVQEKNAGIETAPISESEIRSYVKAGGRIDLPPQNVTSISAPMGGYLKVMTAHPGTAVKKGETLAVLEDAEYVRLQQDYLTSKVKLSLAEKEYSRQKELIATEATSSKIFQQAESEWMSLTIQCQALAEKLRLIGIRPETLTANNIGSSITISAPFSGYVSAVNVHQGRYISPSEIMFELIDPSNLHINVSIFEKDLPKIAPGQSITAWSNSQPSQKFTGKVLHIARNISPDGSTEVHCSIDTRQQKLLPGSFVNVLIETAKVSTLVVPAEAIVRYQGKNYLFIKESKGYQMTEVAVGESENGFTAIIQQDELESKSVVSRGAYALLMFLTNRSEE